MGYSQIPSFVNDNSKVISQITDLLSKENGPVFFSATARPHLANAQTISIWKNVKDLAAFYYQGNHKDVMKRWEGYAYDLGSFVERLSIKREDIPDNDTKAVKDLWEDVFNDKFPKWTPNPIDRRGGWVEWSGVQWTSI